MFAIRLLIAFRLLIVLFSTYLISSCFGYSTQEGARSRCDEGKILKRVATEVLPFNVFRSEIKWQAAKPIKQNGKIVAYQHFLFIIEPNEGIHVYDNADNTAPVALGFLSIPGNSDLIIKDDVLYADSYTDLVKIGIEDGNAVEIGRIELTFEQAFELNSEGIIMEYDYECR